MYPKSLHCSETRVLFWESMTGHIWTCFICIKHSIWGPSTFLFEHRALRNLNECLHLSHDTCPKWWIFLFFYSSTLTPISSCSQHKTAQMSIQKRRRNETEDCCPRLSKPRCGDLRPGARQHSPRAVQHSLCYVLGRADRQHLDQVSR